MTSVSFGFNPERTNVIMGKETLTVWGKDTIEDAVRVRDTDKNFEASEQEIRFDISPFTR